MPRNRDFFHTGLDVSRSDLAGAPFAPYGKNPSGAEDYFVDGNVKVSGDGTSFFEPVKTLTEAIALSEASMGNSQNRWWARRNRIFIMGDRLTETLTALPQKCDIIGLGSCDSFKMACLRGNHTIVSGNGCRFFNVHFDPLTAADIWVMATGGPAQFEFHDCEFKAEGAATAVSGIDTTNIPYFKIINCDFIGAFSGPVIDIGAGAINGSRIVGNYIVGGADDGISETGVATATGTERGLIADNYISVGVLVIDCAVVSVFDIVENTLITPGAFGATSHVIDLTHACHNKLTANDAFSYVPPEPA
jgi:hypothetical protein